MIIDDICDLLLSPAANHSVADVRVGLGYTAVQLDDGRCGLAYTFRNDIQEGCCVIKGLAHLRGNRPRNWRRGPGPPILSPPRLGWQH